MLARAAEEAQPHASMVNENHDIDVSWEGVTFCFLNNTGVFNYWSAMSS